MKANIKIKFNLNSSDKQQILHILMKCDKDFVPNLSKRNSIKDTYFDNKKEIGIFQYYKSVLNNTNIYILAYDKVSNSLCAFCALNNIQAKTLYLSVYCVLTEFRNYGIGQYLLKTAIDYFFNNNFSWLYTRTWSTNYIQIYLLEKFGFKMLQQQTVEYRTKNIISLYYIKAKIE